MVRLVTAALNAVLLAEQRWMQVINAFKGRKYFPASRLLKDAKRFIADATKGWVEYVLEVRGYCM